MTETLNKPTQRQTWAIFCITGIDVRNAELTFEEASEIISLGKVDKAQAVAKAQALNGAEVKRKVASQQDWRALYDEAHAAGMAAGNAVCPTPMVVAQHANPLNDNSPVVQSWYVSEGACGFAWVVIRPGNCSFAKWLRKNDLASQHYGGGVSVWVHQFNQSISRKEAYADAFAEVLRKHGLNAYAGSRLD